MGGGSCVDSYNTSSAKVYLALSTHERDVKTAKTCLQFARKDSSEPASQHDVIPYGHQCNKTLDHGCDQGCGLEIGL